VVFPIYIETSLNLADLLQMRKIMEQRFMFVRTLEEAAFNRVVS